MARETWVQSQVESYQRLKKWYLMPPCLTLSIVRYGSRVKWSNPGKGVAPSPTPWCSSYRKGSLRVTLDYGRQLYLLLKWIKYRILLSFIAGPKIQARGHFLTNQIHIITYLFWNLNIFLLISFWAEFSRFFCFVCLADWLKNIKL